MHFLRGRNVFVKCIFTGTNGNKSTSSLWYCRIKFVHNTNKYWLADWLMQFFFFLLRKWILCWYFCEVFSYFLSIFTIFTKIVKFHIVKWLFISNKWNKGDSLFQICSVDMLWTFLTGFWSEMRIFRFWKLCGEICGW